jgi:alanine racemase
MDLLKTWLEIDSRAAKRNFGLIKSLTKPKTQIWAVVKSNAYGHGLIIFSKIADRLGVDGFCVDSVIEGAKLRQNNIKKTILVLGPTLPGFFREATNQKIALTVSSWETLKKLATIQSRPEIHLKIDTGMHRQGFYIEELPVVANCIKTNKINLKGVYTHFASAKDLNYPTFTDFQFNRFKKSLNILRKAGFKNLIQHAAATGATLINNKYHLDAIRIGIGLYGLWPSKELEMQLSDKLSFEPVLSWHVQISEIKSLKSGDYIGYDLIERVYKPTKMAILPIGYWHGFDRRLSSIGEILIDNQRAKVLGRVSMDLIAVDVTGIKCKVGDRATIIGRQKSREITAYELASKLDTSHYEVITRINPLIERIIV